GGPSGADRVRPEAQARTARGAAGSVGRERNDLARGAASASRGAERALRAPPGPPHPALLARQDPGRVGGAARAVEAYVEDAVATVLALAGLGLGWLAYTMPPDPPAEQKAAEPLPGGDIPVAADRTQPGPRRLVLQAPPPVSVNSVAVSPDGSLLATAADGVR